MIIRKYNLIPKRGRRGEVLTLRDGYRSGKFVYRGRGIDDGGTIKNGWHRIYRGRVDIRWFDVKSNISKDYSEILTFIFNKYKFVKIPRGIYYTNEIVMNKSVNIRGAGTLKLLSQMDNVVNESYPFIKINASSKIEGITIDGSNKSALALEINSKNVIIDKVEIKNIYSDSKGETALGISTHYGNVKIINSYIHHIYAESNNVIADSSGASRAILVGAYDKNNIKEPTIIEDCIFDNILGEEGDCIQSEALTVSTVKTLIINRCKFYNFSRRAVKISSSNAVVTNCDIKNNKSYKNLHCAISAFGNNIKIENNKIDLKYARAFELGLEDSSKVKNYVVKKNIIKSHTSKIQYNSYPIEILNVINAIVDNNIVYRSNNESSAVAIINCRNIKITNNKFYGGKNPAVQIGDSNGDEDDNILVKNSKYIDGESEFFLTAERTINSRFENNYVNNSQIKLYYMDNNCKNIITK